MTDSEILRRIESFCLTKPDGKKVNSVPRTTRLSWLQGYRRLMKEGREDEALALKPVVHKKPGAKPVFTPEVGF